MRLDFGDPVLLVGGDHRQVVGEVDVKLVDAVAQGPDQAEIAGVELRLVEAEHEGTIVGCKLAEAAQATKAEVVDLLRGRVSGSIIGRGVDAQQRHFVGFERLGPQPFQGGGAPLAVRAVERAGREHPQPGFLAAVQIDMASRLQTRAQPADLAGVGDQFAQPPDPFARLRLGQAGIVAELAQERDRLRRFRTIRDAVLGEIRDHMRQRAHRQGFQLTGRAGLVVVGTIELLDGQQQDRMPGFVGVLERPQIHLGGLPSEGGEHASQQMRLAVAAVGRHHELGLPGPCGPLARYGAGVQGGEFGQKRIQGRVVQSRHRERHLAGFAHDVVFERVHLDGRQGPGHGSSLTTTVTNGSA